MRDMDALRRGSGIVVVSVLALVVVAACQRRTNVGLVPADTTTGGQDSSTFRFRETQQLWESGSPESASAATAQLLAWQLRGRTPDTWRDRASYLLDSLAVGADLLDDSGVLAANFFSRSDPETGSWPYLFWGNATAVAYQGIEGKNLHMQGLVARGISGGRDSVRLVSAAFSRRSPGGLQPLVLTWLLPSKAGARWNLVQTLGADSLGGYGAADFEALPDSTVLTARTYRTPPGFVECATCPHAYSMSRFRWTPQGFVRVESHRVPSPYATFAEFIAAINAGDNAAASERVSDPILVLEAQRLGWNVGKGGWRPAPGADESPLRMVFFRGPKDAFAVHFRQQGDRWVIAGFEPVDRSVE